MGILSPGSKGKAFQEQEAFLPQTFPKDDFAWVMGRIGEKIENG